MIGIEKELEVLSQFETKWRTIGWWAETYCTEEEQGVEFGAALFSPNHLKRILDEDHLDLLSTWRNTSSFLKSFTPPPERPTTPSRYYMDKRNWSVAETAVKACGGAIVIAQRLYPGEMPTPKQFAFNVEEARTF